MRISDPVRIFWTQVYHLARANLRSRYRKTIAGFLWVVLNPIIMYGVQSIVFKTFLKINVDNYLVFLLSGLLPWIFMIQSIEMSTSIFVSSGPLLKSFKINPLVCLTAQLLDNFINFLAAFLLILLPLSLLHPPPLKGILLLPLTMIVLISGAISMSWILATLQVFFRDTKFLVSFVTGLLFFLTPVFYPKEFIPAPYRIFAEINPFYRFIVLFRSSLYDYNFATYAFNFILGALLAGLLLLLAATLWYRNRNKLYVYI